MKRDRAISTQTVGQALRQAAVVVDVRSPGEFAKGAVAGAVNIPLFSNGERSEIGTLYRMLGRDRAVHKGLDFLGARMSQFVAAFAPYESQEMLVYCARGGMRSAAVVGLLSALDYRVTQLAGGYKAFRNHALAVFEQGLPPRLIVIHGQTGTGKTLILNRLPNRIDLEDCAQHRSSVFGAINLQPRTQQQFEAHLLSTLEGLDYGRPVWVEGESRKIGDAIMPDALRKAMQRATCVLVTASLQTRIGRIVAEYGREDEATLRQWETALRALTVPLGKKRVEEMVRRVRACDFHPVVEALLVDYYDSRYRHAMRGYNYALSVSSDDLDGAVQALEAFAGEIPDGAGAREELAKAGAG